MDFWGQMASVGGVLILLAVTLWWLRRRGFAAGGFTAVVRCNGRRRQMETVERLPLGPQHSLHLIRFGEQALVVACSPSGCTVVATGDWRELRPHPEALP
jgi:flagellar biogenesis protein FliO